MSVLYQLSDSIGVPIADSYTNSFQSLLEVKWILWIFFYCLKKALLKDTIVYCVSSPSVCVVGVCLDWVESEVWQDSLETVTTNWDSHHHHTELNTTQVCTSSHRRQQNLPELNYFFLFCFGNEFVQRKLQFTKSQVLRLISFGNNNDDEKFPWEGRLC